MGNCVFSLEDCAKAQKVLRRVADVERVDLDAAWREAEAAYMKEFGIAGGDGVGIPAGHYSDDWGRVHKIVAPKPRTPELEIKPRVPCFEHREKSFTFSDGTTWVSCTHDECEFGKRTQRHSDGSPGGAYPNLAVLPDEMPVVESTGDWEGVTEVEELHAEVNQTSVAGDDVETSIRNIDEFFDDGESEESEPENADSQEEEYAVES